MKILIHVTVERFKKTSEMKRNCMEELEKKTAQPKRKKYFFEEHWDEFEAQKEAKRKLDEAKKKRELEEAERVGEIQSTGELGTFVQG